MKKLFSLLLVATVIFFSFGSQAFATNDIEDDSAGLEYFGENTGIKNSLMSLTDTLRAMKNDGATADELDAYLEQYMVQQSRLRYDLDGYINDNLNSAEQAIYDEHPVNSLLCMANGVLALGYAEDNYASTVLHNGNGDAFRHVLWNYGMVCDVGYAFANQWSDAHENGSNSPLLERQMDFYNNDIGLQLGVDNPSTILHSTFISKSKAKVHNGYCKIISGTALVWSGSAGEL
jgi:hypothetical protein